ncbi:MAG: hypothetical protein A3H60_02330 [Candidatus Zambryskibacteria bacterium RIFCSPLOWO2_02_FULL_44_12b]|uniref:Uncharacterized protein n=1 Tax=Candidatus Zambryskibacteria bacterium RIFCSPLOWO2_02_FULL_44_12b TaxID=1802772 RepID=A0A1G2UJV3_9BACT|nr:MAG: hypothetical protein A3H60_02330 [Candidatus Zambryskibacteria bacterium RIFCSPLOWO2_02_FULL_44_12b]
MSTLADVKQARTEVWQVVESFGAQGEFMAEFDRKFGILVKVISGELQVFPWSLSELPDETELGSLGQEQFDRLREWLATRSAVHFA